MEPRRLRAGWRGPVASGSHPDLIRVPYVLYGVKYIDLVSLALFSGQLSWKWRRALVASPVFTPVRHPPPCVDVWRGHCGMHVVFVDCSFNIRLLRMPRAPTLLSSYFLLAFFFVFLSLHRNLSLHMHPGMFLRAHSAHAFLFFGFADRAILNKRRIQETNGRNHGPSNMPCVLCLRTCHAHHAFEYCSN